MEAWSAEGVAQDQAGERERIFRRNDRAHEVLAAKGSEVERTCCGQGGEAAWTARVVVGRSPAHAARQAAGGETRLVHAETALAALTPPRGRGKRQVTDESALLEAIDTVLKAHRVEGLLRMAWEKQTERTTQDVGRGRGSASRQKRVIKTIRSHRTCLARQGDNIAALGQRFGWKAFVTNAGHKRRSFQKDQATLPGWHPENTQKMTDKPTVERILKVFSPGSLTLIKPAAGEEILRRLTPLSGAQEEILQRLGLGTSLYGRLEIQEIGI